MVAAVVDLKQCCADLYSDDNREYALALLLDEEYAVATSLTRGIPWVGILSLRTRLQLYM